jgi:cytochrome c oxidase subunit II
LKRTLILVLALCAFPGGAHTQGESGNVATIKAVDVVASRFRFEPSTIAAAQGQTIRLRLRSADGPHSIAIKAFRVKIEIPKAGDVVTANFVADKVGTFAFTCAEYCGTGHSDMKGIIIVESRR